jgi:hypothetical protein
MRISTDAPDVVRDLVTEGGPENSSNCTDTWAHRTPPGPSSTLTTHIAGFRPACWFIPQRSRACVTAALRHLVTAA